MSSLINTEKPEEKSLDFTIVDVFADRIFQGNQLTVVRTGRKLTGDQMMAITREF